MNQKLAIGGGQREKKAAKTGDIRNDRGDCGLDVLQVLLCKNFFSANFSL